LKCKELPKCPYSKVIGHPASEYVVGEGLIILISVYSSDSQRFKPFEGIETEYEGPGRASHRIAIQFSFWPWFCSIFPDVHFHIPKVRQSTNLNRYDGYGNDEIMFPGEMLLELRVSAR
jgi:hypothetical protein